MSLNKNAWYWQALLLNIYSKIWTFWNVFIVTSSSDTSLNHYQQLQDIFTPQDWIVKFYTSLSDAYNACQSWNHDVIVLDWNTSHILTSMLTVSKNRVHFIGIDYLLWNHRAYWQSTKVELWVTSDTANIATILNTWVRNSFRWIKFINNDTLAQSLYTFVDWWEYTYIEDCEFYKSTQLTVTWSAEFVCNADSANYVNCTFWSLADARSWAIIRAAMLFTKAIAWTWKVARDVLIKDSNFWIQCTNTANRFVYWANATDIERNLTFDRCKFISNWASSATPAQNVAFWATLTVWNVLLNNCVAIWWSTAMSTTTWVFVNWSVPAADTTWIALQAT